MRSYARAAALATLALAGGSGMAEAAFTDLKFGQYQIADSQWDVGNCTTTSSCEIFSKIPGVGYQIPFFNGQIDWGTNGDR